MTTHSPFFILFLVLGGLLGSGRAWAPPAKRWSHLELGAGNTSHGTRISSLAAFTALKGTLDRILKERGPEGVFYVNDLEEKDAALAAAALYDYLHHRPDADRLRVEIRVLPGDMTRIELPWTDTVDLKNPDYVLLGGDPRSHGNWALGQGRLRRLAARSRQGMRIESFQIEILDALVERPGELGIRELGEAPLYVDNRGVEKDHRVKAYQITGGKIPRDADSRPRPGFVFAPDKPGSCRRAWKRVETLNARPGP